MGESKQLPVGCYGVCSDDGSEGLITAHDIVVEIENLGEYFNKLNEGENSNLSMNLGLSNLGIEYGQSKFQDLHSQLITCLKDVLDEYKNRPANTHWDMGFVLQIVENAVSLIKEVSVKLSESPYQVLDSDKYQKQFLETLEPFTKTTGFNFGDPMYISHHFGGSFTENYHGEAEYERSRFNGIVRINQYCGLVEEIISSIEFRIKLLDGDRVEMLSNLDLVNRVGNMTDFSGRVFTKSESNNEYGPKKTGPWHENSLPLDGYYEKLLYELDAIDAMYSRMDTSNANWEDVITHLNCFFNRDLVEHVQHFFKDYSDISFYDGMEAGLTDMRNLENEYNRWYSRFEALKLNPHGF
jgi:hypothetical protein